MASRFSIRVERTVVDSTFVEVSAENEDEAMDAATRMTEKKPSRFEWELESENFEATDAEEEFSEDEDDDTDEDEEESDEDE